jgi:hypothetical protein
VIKQHRTAFGFLLVVAAMSAGIILGTLTSGDSWSTLAILGVGAVCAVINKRAAVSGGM